MRQIETQQLEAETSFTERIAEDRVKCAAQRESLERQLQDLTATDNKLSEQKRDWEERQEKAYDELMSYLENEDVDSAGTQFGDHFNSLIKSMNNLSHDSMNGQFNSLKNNLDELNIEKKQLEVAIADQSSTISEMIPSLRPTCGATYKERNTLRIIFHYQVAKLRSEYQKCRLQEEALKARLST